MSDERLYLLVKIAGHRVAIDAGSVGSVIEMDEITPVPRVSPHIRGLHALRSRVLTVIDAGVAAGAKPKRIEGLVTAVVLEIEGHGYALIVDEVLDVVAAPPPAASGALLGPAWARVSMGRLQIGGEIVLLVSPAALIAEPDAIAA